MEPEQSQGVLASAGPQKRIHYQDTKDTKKEADFRVRLHVLWVFVVKLGHVAERSASA
jgi:hypothetical protein